jgi:hypothetical protein
VQTFQFSLGRQQPIEDAVFRAADPVMQRHGQRLETLLVQEGRQILQQTFGTRQFAQAHFGGELPAGDGAHEDRGTSRVQGLPSLASRIVSPA